MKEGKEERHWKKLKKLNLGCAKDYRPDYWNIDIVKTLATDEVVDVEKGLPYPDNHFEEVYINHVLSFLLKLDFVIKEIYRVCKCGARIFIKEFHFTSRVSFQDTHLRSFTYTGFERFTDSYKGELANPALFKIVSKRLVFPGGLNPLNYVGKLFFSRNHFLIKIYENTFLRSFFFCNDIIFELEKTESKKGGKRQKKKWNLELN